MATSIEATPQAATAAQRLLEETGGVEGGIVDGRVSQTPQEALKQDLELTARANGWAYEEAEARYRAAEEVGAVAEAVARDRPDIFVGSALAPEPGGAPTLYIKGPADDYIRNQIATSAVKIVVDDKQPFSFEELEGRSWKVHSALVDLGFPYVATSVNITGGGVILSAVTVQASLPTQPDDILAALPADVRDDVLLTVHPTPVVEDEAAFGGMPMRDDGTFECTSGWSVRDLSTNQFGVSTAGHCDGLNEIRHPGDAVHDWFLRAEHRGAYGDVQWGNTNESEPDDFYSDADTIRDVGAVEARSNISVGETVCAYGRASNDRDCSLEVQDVSQSCTNGGVTNNRLVLMNGDTQIPGDSGGGWSVSVMAYGSHKGQCSPDFPNLEVFSVADLYDEALGIRVTCGC